MNRVGGNSGRGGAPGILGLARGGRRWPDGVELVGAAAAGLRGYDLDSLDPRDRRQGRIYSIVAAEEKEAGKQAGGRSSTGLEPGRQIHA